MTAFFTCGQMLDWSVDLPDAGGGDCCIGAAVYGPERCTCWEPIYDQAQTPPNLRGTPEPRAEPCGDCAFRSDSPESRGDPLYAPYNFNPRRPFYCHQGMRRVVAYRHPSGVEVPATVADRWAPPEVDGVVFKANGLTADLCAGWAARATRAGTTVTTSDSHA